MNRYGDWIQTFSGRKFWPLDPRPEEIHVYDVAHALSNLCRFTGHVKSFYSVAQHSVLVSRQVPPDLAMAGLLHDAAEAYLGDHTRPVKAYLLFKSNPLRDRILPWEFGEVEERLLGAIGQAFGVNPHEFACAAVKNADEVLLKTEARDLMAVPPEWRWGKGVTALRDAIAPLPPDAAEQLFLHRYVELGGKL